MRNQTAYMRCAPSSSRTRSPGHISSKRRCQSKRQQFPPPSLALNPTPDLVLAPPPLLPTAAGLPVASSCLLSCLSPDFLFLSAPKIGAEAKALCPRTRTYPAPLLGKKDEIRWKAIQKRSHNRRSNGSFEIQGDARDHQQGCGQGRSGRPEAVQ